MRTRGAIPALIFTIVIAACGGGTAGTQAPNPTSANGGGGGTPTDAAEPTDAPDATQTSGGGGGGGEPAGWDQYGKVHIDISGPVQKSADYGFIPAGSLFGGSAGSSFNFTIEGTNEVVSILVGDDGKVIVSYGGEDFAAPAAECTTSNWNVGATSASGAFDCKAALVIMASGATLQNATIKGSFDAHA